MKLRKRFSMKSYKVKWTAGLASLTMGVALGAGAQAYPKPTPAMQAGIDKDGSRHFGSAPADGGPMATGLSSKLEPADIDTAMRKVADWQLKESEPYFDRIWTWSVLYTGFMAASRATDDPKYRDAMLRMSEHYNFEERSKLPNADDQSVGSTYEDLYLLQPAGTRDAKWIDPTRAALDSLMPYTTLPNDAAKIPWWWCDALFMAPAVWVEMSAATGDHKYIDYMNENWARSYALLWDPAEHLYLRDATYKTKTEANGKKMFWSRGEGWVMGGLARTLDYLPANDPHRAFYIQNLREMSARVAQLQGSDGLWHAGLLNPEAYPLPEISGSALMVYGMAYGVNHGILDRNTYEPVIARAWAGMLKHIYADGRLGDIQQTGAEPAFYDPTSSYTYGVGGFLLAGAEVKKLAGGSVAPAPGIAGAPLAGQKQPAQTPGPTDPSSHAKIVLPVPANPNLPSLFFVGDSTVRNGRGDGAGGQWGWGDEMAPFFNTAKINVVNRAIGGRSSRSYIIEGQWAQTLALIQPGDVVLFQWGHNDGGDPADPARARASLPGIGDETRDIFNPVTRQPEVVHTYGWYLTKYVDETRAKGATPIICSLIPRKIWKDGKVVLNTDNYAGWAHQIADKEHIGFIDLNGMIAARYDQMGEAAVEPMFGDPHTHTSLAGAKLNAEIVIRGLKDLSQDPVKADFSAAGQAIAP
jgi:unsaturated rhamnogalacturonyl hydrolase